MTGGEPEHVLHREPLLAESGLRERRRALGFLPRAAEVGRAEYGRPEMACAHRAEQRFAVARVEHQVVDDVAEKMGSCERPAPARAVRADEERALARSDEQRHRSRSRTRGRLRGFGFRHEQPLYVFSPSIQRAYSIAAIPLSECTRSSSRSNICSGVCTEGPVFAMSSFPQSSHQAPISSRVISTWHCMPRCLPSTNAWFAQYGLPAMRVAFGGMVKVSPCQ